MQKLTPFLWFDTQAEDAAKFYVSVFKKGKITKTVRYGNAGPGSKGSVMTVAYTINGMNIVNLNGGPYFKHSEAFSFFVSCKTQKEIDYYWNKLSKGGSESRCGWLKDKFGLSWQIIPENLPSLISTEAGMAAMMKMKKLDIKVLKAASAKPKAKARAKKK